MNLEEINKWLEKEEGMSYTRLEELHDFFYERYTNLHCILTELEEYLTKIAKNGADIEKLTCSNILVYLKELKEKYNANTTN